jgi:hypothetical protein
MLAARALVAAAGRRATLSALAARRAADPPDLPGFESPLRCRLLPAAAMDAAADGPGAAAAADGPAAPQQTTAAPPAPAGTARTFYRRELLPPALALAAPGGQALFAAALAAGGARGFFPLIQRESSCVLGRPVEAENILQTNQPTNQSSNP